MAVSSGLSSRRQARLQQDIQSITALCSANPVLQVFTPPTSESLVVLLNGPTHRAEYTFTFTEDYPENTIVVCSQEADNVVVISKPLTIAVWEICAENGVSLFSGSSDRLWHDGGGIVPGHEGGGMVPGHEGGGMVPGHEGGEMGPGHEGGEMGPGHEGGGTVEMEEDAHPHSEDTPLSLGTQVSVTSSEYLDEEFYEDYDCYDPDMTEENVVHPLLERELDLVQAVYGQNALETRIHGGIDEMDIFINIDLNTFLDEHMASAWGVNESQPLIILLHILSISKYLEGLEPKVNVFQVKDDVAPTASAYDASTKRRKIGISSQLEKILQAFVSKQWRKISVSTVERAMSGETHSSKTPETRHMVDPREDAKLAKLVEMGFRAEEAREALHQCRGDVEAACELLATTPSAASSSGGGSGFLSSLVSFLPGYMRQDSMGAQLEVTEHHDPEEDKRTPSLEKGFLVQVVRYALNRLKSLNEFCVICDEKHVLESGLIKPCVCTRELCVFAFQTLGVMADAAEAIATDRDVVDLLIAMANSAAHSPRAAVILDPFPSIVDPSNVNVLALDPQKKDFDLMKRVIKEVVSTRVSLETRDCINLKQKMDETDPLAFPLLQWIIATCRAHIVLLPEPRQIKSMQTKHQFLLISSPPAKEVAFQQAKQKHGSTYAFHGSSIENWHSIMRKSLVNASGTKFQLHGAAYGKGIYLSPVSTVSFGYTGGLFYMPTTRHRQDVQCLANKTNLKCLALCEVVTSKDLKKHNDIWVCPNTDHVCTRFFFVYEGSMDNTDSFDTRQSQCKKEINHAVAHIRQFKKR